VLVRGLRASLPGRTGDVEPPAEDFQEHLEICGECREEFEALLAALRAVVEA
jgi:hypothetical protein